ncbi:MAG: hypothetical protein R3C05_18985 [Pirellulaceae bacterium]
MLIQPKPVANASHFLDWVELHPTNHLAADVLVVIIVTGGKSEPAIRAVNLLAAHHLELDSDRFFKVAPLVFDAVGPDEADRWFRKFAVDGGSRQTPTSLPVSIWVDLRPVSLARGIAQEPAVCGSVETEW